MTIDREATLIAHVPPRGAQRLGADGGFADAVTGRLQSAAESSAHRPEQDVLVKMLNDAWDAEAASRLQGDSVLPVLWIHPVPRSRRQALPAHADDSRHVRKVAAPKNNSLATKTLQIPPDRS